MPPLRILIAEDDALIGLGIQYALMDLGCHPLGPATTASHALALIDAHDPHGAILDISLEDSSGFTVADELMRRGIPFVFGSGNALDPARKTAYGGVVELLKPYSIEAVEQHLLMPLQASLVDA